MWVLRATGHQWVENMVRCVFEHEELGIFGSYWVAKYCIILVKTPRELLLDVDFELAD